MPTIPYKTRQAIIAQALKEIQFAREYKQGKVKNWKINEDLYYSRKSASLDSRANVDLGKMSAFVHTIMSKIDTPLTFKFTKRKTSQLQRVEQLNALRTADQEKDYWDIKDIAGKKQGVIYGRAIYSYYADAVDGGYQAHLDNIDVYDFLIDPSAGGIDIERAMYLGDYGVVKTRTQLEEGVKSKRYLKIETQALLDGSGNSTEEPQEETNKKNRTRDTNVTVSQKEIGDKDKFKFWRWGTTYEGQRYYMTLSEKGGTAIEITEIEDLFPSGLWWYWTWAAFIDLTEFWTPSFCDYVREVFMAQAVSINQMLDNGEMINKPQRVVNVGAIENMAELKYRREGIIRVKKDVDFTKAYQTVVTPAITTAVAVFNTLEGIQEKASGVTAGAQGDADGNNSTATVYQGNQENSADRFGLLNRSYAFGYKRFAKLYEWGVRDNLLKKIAVDILGPNGVEIMMVSKRDIFRKNESFNISVEASNAETALSEQEKQTKIAFLTAQQALIVAPGTPPTQNPKKAYEIMAGIAGFDADTVRQLQDTSEFGDAAILAQAERDIERLLDGEKFPPNQSANTAYKQRFVDYMTDNQEENLTMDEFTTLANYVLQLEPIIQRNMVRDANDFLMKQKMAQIAAPQNPAAPAAPAVPGAPIAPAPGPTGITPRPPITPPGPLTGPGAGFVRPPVQQNKPRGIKR